MNGGFVYSGLLPIDPRVMQSVHAPNEGGAGLVFSTQGASSSFDNPTCSLYIFTDCYDSTMIFCVKTELMKLRRPPGPGVSCDRLTGDSTPLPTDKGRPAPDRTPLGSAFAASADTEPFCQANHRITGAAPSTTWTP